MFLLQLVTTVLDQAHETTPFPAFARVLFRYANDFLDYSLNVNSW